MKTLLRRLRGILGTGALWGATGAAVGSVVGAAVSLVLGIPLGFSLPLWGIGMTVVGMGLGCSFAAVLAVFEGRRTLDRLTPGRAGLWGALAGGLLPVVWLLISLGDPWTAIPLRQIVPLLLAAVGSYAVVSGGLAAATVWIARRAPAELSSGDGGPEALPGPRDE